MNDWLRARFVSIAVATLVIAGALCGPVALYLTLTGDAASTSDSELDLPDARSGVAGQFAAMFVASWLQGDNIDFYNPTLQSTDSGLLVERVAAVRTIDRGDGLFDVVVAADLVEFLEASEERYRPVGLRFYSVGVGADDDGALIVFGPPSVVAAPSTGALAAPVVTDLQPASNPELAPLIETLDGFFAAYLSGAGDVGLFTSPDSVIGAVDPPAFSRATVTRLGWGAVPGIDDPNLRLARVEVAAETPAGRQLLEYSIVLAARDARWEISQVLHAPVVIRGGVAE